MLREQCPLPLLATQILWINLLTDSGPALALGVEPQDPSLMRQRPRDPKSRVIPGKMWLEIILVSAIMAAGTLLVLDWSLPGGPITGTDGTMTYARTMVFTVLVLFQLFNVFNARAQKSTLSGLFTNRWIWLAILLSALLQVGVVSLPFLQRSFDTVPLRVTDWVVCIAVASSVLWMREVVKLVMRLLSSS